MFARILLLLVPLGLAVWLLMPATIDPVSSPWGGIAAALLIGIAGSAWAWSRKDRFVSVWVGVAFTVVVVVSVVTGPRLAYSGGSSPEERLFRKVCRLAPGYGPTNRATVLGRRLAPMSQAAFAAHAERAIAGLREIETGPWADDALLLRAFVLRKLAAADETRRDQAHRDALDAYLEFSDDGQLERWTKRGYLAQPTGGLVTDEDTRLRIAAAGEATELALRAGLDDVRPHRRIRELFDEQKLDRTHDLYVRSIILEAGQYKDRKQWATLIELYDRMLVHSWPESLRKPMERERNAAEENL